jgi:uncharacterized protein
LKHELVKNNGVSNKQISSQLRLQNEFQNQSEKDEKGPNEACSDLGQESYQKNTTEKLDAIVSRKETDQCQLMVQSPTSLFCYWSFSSRKKRIVQYYLNENWDCMDKKIRLYDITSIIFNGHNAHRLLEYSLPENCKQWFFNHLASNRTYCVDIGIVTSEGSFFSLIRSNANNTPRLRDEVSPNHRLNWEAESKNEPHWLNGFSSYSYYEK